jgi:transposase
VFEAFLEDLMWTPIARAQHSRAGLRYGSDLTDAEWVLLEPFLPPPCRRGRCCPPLSTVYRWFARFRDDGTWETINHHIYQPP